MALKLLSDRILIKVDEVAYMTDSGIHIPDEAQEKSKSGFVFSHGPGRAKDDLISVKEGDHVFYDKNAGMPIFIKDTEYLMIRENDILAIL